MSMPKTPAERRRKHYYSTQAPRHNMAYCSVCGDILRRGGLAEQVGFHQRCDRAAYQKAWRAAKEQSNPQP